MHNQNVWIGPRQESEVKYSSTSLGQESDQNAREFRNTICTIVNHQREPKHRLCCSIKLTLNRLKARLIDK